MAGTRLRVSVKDRSDLSGFANVETCRPHADVPIASESELLVTGFSTWRATSSLTAMHIVAPDGPIFSLYAWSSSHPDELKALHDECLGAQKSAVAPYRNGLEVHLVAVPDCRGELNRNTCFWGFCCPQSEAYYYKSLLEMKRLVVVLDLDETLVQALTLAGLKERLEGLTRDIEAETDPHRISVLEEDRERLVQNYDELQEFALQDTVTVDGGHNTTPMGSNQEWAATGTATACVHSLTNAGRLVQREDLHPGRTWGEAHLYASACAPGVEPSEGCVTEGSGHRTSAAAVPGVCVHAEPARLRARDLAAAGPGGGADPPARDGRAGGGGAPAAEEAPRERAAPAGTPRPRHRR
eukprot:CAMPEP_0118940938 /NCGR_PEP_ID=MMETSP1169-20130426/32686_1 /TAXON_ID=36882 /ORGANISM="Pyramimonas obovata, Strain CCMP722" /LENGTH=353 /DNA_ID=CAMNT_0006885567 /DNA_START=240 /DNA_END=1297 /DNA_ORIENTATION=+